MVFIVKLSDFLYLLNKSINLIYVINDDIEYETKLKYNGTLEDGLKYINLSDLKCITKILGLPRPCLLSNKAFFELFIYF